MAPAFDNPAESGVCALFPIRWFRSYTGSVADVVESWVTLARRSTVERRLISLCVTASAAGALVAMAAEGAVWTTDPLNGALNVVLSAALAGAAALLAFPH